MAAWCHMKPLPSRRVLCTPYNHAPFHFMKSHIHKVHACLAVTCPCCTHEVFPTFLYVCLRFCTFAYVCLRFCTFAYVSHVSLRLPTFLTFLYVCLRFSRFSTFAYVCLRLSMFAYVSLCLPAFLYVCLRFSTFAYVSHVSLRLPTLFLCAVM